jgi:hypothetical protein
LWKSDLGMGVSIFRNVICWAMIVIFPSSLLAADSRAAILHTQGQVWVNGTEAADSTAIMPGDLLETKPGVVANLTTDGSAVLIQEQSIVKYNGDSLTLEHGGVSVGTSRSMSVQVNCLKVVPVSNEWTQYEVTDVSGQIKVNALKLDVNILRGASMRKQSPENAASGSATVHEGQQATRDESEACGGTRAPSPAGSPVNTKWVEIGAAAGGGGLILCLLLCNGKKPPQMSQSAP